MPSTWNSGTIDMADDSNLKGHVATYDGLIGLMKWGAVAVAVIVAAVILLIAR